VKELKFGQTVFIIQNQCINHPGRRIVGYKLEHEKRVVFYRVVASDNFEAFLEGYGFVKRSEIFTDRKEAEKELKRVKEEDYLKNNPLYKHLKGKTK